MKNAKGLGERINNTITLEQRVKLIDWIRGAKDDKRSYRELATAATLELGFIVTDNVLQGHWIVVNGQRNVCGKAKISRFADVDAKIEKLESRLSEVESILLKMI